MLTDLDYSLKITGNPTLLINIDVRFTSKGQELFIKSLDNKSILDSYLKINNSSILKKFFSFIKQLQ